MSSSTLKAIFDGFATEYRQGKPGITTALDTTTTLTDTARFLRLGSGSEFARNSPIRITARAAIASGSAVPGEERYLSDYDPTTGIFTTTTMTQIPRAGTEFIIAYPVSSDFSTTFWLEALNRFLTETAERRMRIPLTFVPNGDYIAAATVGWTQTNATTSPAYVELAHPDGYYTRAMVVTASGADGRVASTTLKATPGDTWNLYTFNRVTVAGAQAKLVIRCESTGADITPTFQTGAATYSGLAFRDILCQFVIPASCTQISIRLQSTTSGDVSHWGPVVAAPQNTLMYTGQTALEYIQSVSDLQSFVIGTNGPQERAWYPVPWKGEDDNMGWGRGFTFGQAMPFPLFANVLMHYPAMVAGDPTSAAVAAAASESDTTACPKPLAIAGMAVEFLEWAHRQERLQRGPDSAQTRFGGLLDDARANLITAQTAWDAPKRIGLRKHFTGYARA